MKTRPADRAAQPHRDDLDPGLLAQLAGHPRPDVLVRLDLAPQPVPFAELLVIGSADAVHHQHLPAVGREDEAERGQLRAVGHGRPPKQKKKKIRR
ncbi:hypothetical protein SDC9_96492 [bioreactor metagenome]|uniref:Uncharacterized protein n=1 Tax=bioreactor metagenome TaxID=1076179 RepID=A0A645ABW0_9ZZZZ